MVDIIGAGIGGLTTAIALQQKGIKTRIFEQAKTIKPVGAGIILANNAMQVYERLGLKKEIEENGNRISSMNITNPNLQPISRIDLKYFEEKYKVQNIAIHRGKLQQLLLEQLDHKRVHLNYQLVDVKKVDTEFQLIFGNNTTINSKILLGADGINSVVRNHLFTENKIRDAFQACWRGVTTFDLPIKFQNELNEAWGNGNRFGFVQIAPNKVYWYALKSFKQDEDELSIHELSSCFTSFHPLINELIKATPIDGIHSARITDLSPTQNWYNGNVCLLGDAAHATTPNMGQGACQAIEDAYILSECLQKHQVSNKAFSAFQKLRIPKAHHVVNTSWTLGKIAHWRNPLAIFLRNQLMMMTPASISRKQSERIFQLETV